MIRKYLLSITIILTSYISALAQAPANIGWTGPETAILPYANACNGYSDITCLGSGTGTTTPFVSGVHYTIINDQTPGVCSQVPTPMSEAWMQIWEGDMSSCNSATPLGTPALNNLDITLTGTGPYFLAISSLDPTADNNLCGGGKGHDFTGQSATIRYRQETSIINTTSTDSHCMNEGKPLSYSLVGTHNNPDVEWEVTVGSGYFIGNLFYATQPGLTTIRARVGVCFDDITYEAIEVSSAPTSIDGPTEICEGSTFTLEAQGGYVAPNTQYEWGTGTVVGVNPIAVTNTATYTPDPIFSDETFWVRRISNSPNCEGYTLGTTHFIDVYNDIPNNIFVNICEGETYMFDGEPLTESVSNYAKVFETERLQCDSTVVLDLFVEPLPRALFPRDTTMCHGQTITLDAGNPGSSYVWNTGSTSRTITTNEGGQYIVYIESINGCSNIDTIDVEMLYVYPIYSMIYVQNLDRYTFKFEILNPVDIDEVYWDMGDNSPLKVGMTTQHTYASEGNYVVSVELETVCGYLNDQISTHVVNILDRSNKKQIKWYPNPTRDYLIIDAVNGEPEKIKSVRIVDIQGRVRQEVLWQGQDQYRLELPDLNSGVYQILLMSKDNAVLHQNSIQVIK